MNILVTGGAGYVGSHCCVQLIAAGHRPVILDNLANAKPGVLDHIERVAGTRPQFVRGDVRDGDLVAKLLRDEGIDAAIHFAGLKAVGESVQRPLDYYDNNVHGSLVLLQAMRATGVRTLVFSSSATVYGDAERMPLREDAPTSATNPYGRSKLMVEQMLADLAAADADLSLTALRYFNPVGAHPSGLLGEDPQGLPNNLMPFVAQVAVGRRERLAVFGNDYPTPDGTGLRDYVHVLDLADGHVAALGHAHGRPGLHVFNLGTGRGHSVLELLAAFGRACGHELPHAIAPRRAGDVAASWADPARAESLLGWRARRGLDEMCADTWRWQSTYPNGYPE
ncbi:UDP-glucose 4-epimerase GalE [Roseateles saccharophilus]|uniref:UDP-glucose 4-epimerase n=1 Tax=Roseateles saccharophilus TaxID=304 RepID=A0A4R3VAJ0_ROSSA|nr:UDP-glucose 4-epimerase GalE [Roseateles saccharophilus]MDG0835384.1 UDP-glucose 4-epimerase GalE [Roseateles saccharophilus]TCV02246.1 UDP-galactose 4-epimerase [Roseateles saccharophilus]